ncbi:hypothetical protein DdX_01676 [Ditylenchus destructor]|uniref:Uncharacterized protein n=1 Tax=Ditylenchus destructor TaxID=166010 RepID=A0AAD4NIJ1_9BILA|nr:hypothetical protein DdX_01676 [Ditylenchus destructor]
MLHVLFYCICNSLRTYKKTFSFPSTTVLLYIDPECSSPQVTENSFPMRRQSSTWGVRKRPCSTTPKYVCARCLTHILYGLLGGGGVVGDVWGAMIWKTTADFQDARRRLAQGCDSLRRAIMRTTTQRLPAVAELRRAFG